MTEPEFRGPPQAAFRRGEMAWWALAAVIVLSSSMPNAIHGRPAVPAVAMVLGLFALAGAWRFPSLSLVLAAAAGAAVPDDRALLLPVVTCLYVIACRQAWLTAVLTAVASATVMTVGGAIHGGHTISERGGLLGFAISNATACASAVALGLYLLSRRRVLDGLREQTARLERERELLAERAVAEERIRIAQELHDIVAHNVSLMVVEAQALGASVDNAAVGRTTTAIADLGRQAMAQMHMTLRLLRVRDDSSNGVELAPQPGLAQLDELVERSRAAGLPIELSISGRRHELGQDVDLSAFRIVQEAITNVIKHAAGTRTNIMVAYHPDAVHLAVRNITNGPPPEQVARLDGHGLIGMRERAAMLGGELTAEPLDDGFQVIAVLPYTTSPAS
jgi:signal transduction histidine kinase